MSLTPSAQYAVTARLEYPHEPGWIARIASVIAEQGGSINSIDLVHIHRGRSLRDYTIECPSTDQETNMVDALRHVDGVTVHSVSDDTFLMHLGGKLEIHSKVPLKTRADLSMAYTPGVARVCTAIEREPQSSFNLTIRKNCVAVISDGSTVLGLGNIGGAAAMPVMEGKAILFKEFGGVDAFPLCLDTQDPDQIVQFCQAVAPTFGGINLEDIAAPKCFDIEQRLTDLLDIPVFHDDQHGTAVVVLAGFINALKLTDRSAGDVKLVVTGAGAAGMACTRALWEFGVRNIIVFDPKGPIHPDRDLAGNLAKQWLAENTNPDRYQGDVHGAMSGADMFVGVSGPDVLSRADIQAMNPNPIVFAMSNPNPEIMPEEIDGIPALVATGRSDYPNQINNVLAFPGLFRGALDCRAARIDAPMKHAAAQAIAGVIAEEELSVDYFIPSAFDRKVAQRVAATVADAARESGVARRMPKGMIDFD